ncbi:MAG: prephenate dehydrogenase/arogenate dehydrogenase family protein [Candidatus Hydrogenedentes bacterium]|nr:prephenate dehydrogenase/arogenate dehydrogenase family protein [Candidatus Hydrogenedentota bacterium]
MATPTFDRLALVGVGLLGGSIGKGLKQRGLVSHVAGVGHRASSLDAALACGAIDKATTHLEEVIPSADLIVICTPALLIPDVLDRVRPLLKPGAAVTDVGSTKAHICAHAAATWPAPRRFVGSHPMAGSEKFGPEHSDPGLFVNAVCLLESSPEADPAARARIAALWASLGARVVDMDPVHHDRLVAHSSHIPHILSALIATIAARQEGLGPVIGNGFRDMTRIAAGRPAIWRDIALSNRDAILEGLEEAAEELAQFKRALEANDAAAVEAYFEAGRAAREKALQ